MIVPWATRLSFARMWYAFGAFWILGSDRLRLAFYSGLDALTGRSCFSQNFDQVAFYSALPFRADQCCIHGIQPFVSLTSKFMVSVVTNTTKSFISWKSRGKAKQLRGTSPTKKYKRPIGNARHQVDLVSRMLRRSTTNPCARWW